MAGFFRKKTVMIILALLMAASVPIGGTYSWLTVNPFHTSGSAKNDSGGSRAASSPASPQMARGARISRQPVNPRVRLAANGDVYAPGFFRFSGDHAGKIAVPVAGLSLTGYLLETQSELLNGLVYDEETPDEYRFLNEAVFSDWLAGFLNDNSGFISCVTPVGGRDCPVSGDVLLSFKSYENKSTMPVFMRVSAAPAGEDEGEGADANLLYAALLMERDSLGGWNFIPLTRIGDYYYNLEPIYPDTQYYSGNIYICFAAYVFGSPNGKAQDASWALGGNTVDVIQSVRGMTGGGSALVSPWMDEGGAGND